MVSSPWAYRSKPSLATWAKLRPILSWIPSCSPSVSEVDDGSGRGAALELELELAAAEDEEALAELAEMALADPETEEEVELADPGSTACTLPMPGPGAEGRLQLRLPFLVLFFRSRWRLACCAAGSTQSSSIAHHMSPPSPLSITYWVFCSATRGMSNETRCPSALHTLRQYPCTADWTWCKCWMR